MTTLREIVTMALRESNTIAAGATPDSGEFDEALVRLQNFIKTLIGNELGDPLTDWTYGTQGLVNTFAVASERSSEINQTYVPSNTRVIFNNASAVTLYLPPMPSDGTRIAVLDNAGTFDTANVVLNGNGRKIEGSSSTTLSTEGLAREWFYRSDTGNWVRVTDLAANDESPFPQEFDDLLICSLAMRLNPRYGGTSSGELLDALRRNKSQFRARYSQSKEVLPDTLSAPSYGTSLTNTARFNFGRP